MSRCFPDLVRHMLPLAVWASLGANAFAERDPLPASAYWLGQTNGLWTGSNNWATDFNGTAPSRKPGAQTDVTFSAFGAAHQETTLGEDFTIHSLTVNDPTAVTIGGTNTLTISGTDGTTGITVNAGAGLLAISSDLHLVDQGSVITVNNDAGVVLSGAVSGCSGLTKLGSGTLTLSGQGSFSGELLVDSGAFVLTGSAGFDDGVVGFIEGYNQLTISNGGILHNSTVRIGDQESASVNSALVTGCSSLWNIDGDLNVGFAGNYSSLTVEQGGSVTANYTKLGGGTTSYANSLTVDGAGSTLTNTNDLIVGYEGSFNTVQISHGGLATNNNAFLGLFADSQQNKVTVTGTGSLWTNLGTLYIGDAGSYNQLQIEDGGQVTVTGLNQDTLVGYGTSSYGNEMGVVGAGSKFQSAATLYIGKAGSNNSLYIYDGAVVEDKNGRVGFDAGSDDNYVSVGGKDSLWKNNGTLRVGNLGSYNNVDIYSGGHVTVGANMFVGYGASADNNRVTVSGTDSLLSVGGALTIGLNGHNNSVWVSDSGTVNAAGGIVLASGTGSSGSLVIGGFGKKDLAVMTKSKPLFDTLPGFVDTPAIVGGAGRAEVVFEHSGSAYAFDPLLSGSLTVVQAGAGQTILTGANTFSGTTLVVSGTLTTADASALGTSDVFLQDFSSRSRTPVPFLTPPTLKASGALTVRLLDWAGGSIELDPTIAPITVTNGFVNSGGSNFVVTSSANLTLGQTYALVNFGHTDFAPSDFTLTYSNTNVSILGQFAVTGTQAQEGGDRQDGQVLLTILGAVATGKGLQNSNPVDIPTFASFFVNGLVNTGSPTDNNVIGGLSFAPGSLLNVFNQLSVTTGNFIVNSGSATIGGTGTTVTPGDFNKLGQGLLNLIANVLVNGNTNINAGTLAVNGQLTTDNLFVQLTTFLKGSGIVFGNVINNGTVAPGNSPGTLTINGNYTQTNNGALNIEIASPTLFDRLIVSGQASLAGVLNVIGYNGYNLKYGQQFTFLQAGSVSGNFSSINMPAGNLRGRILESGGDVTLLVAPKSYVQVAQTQNQKNVAKALNNFIKATSGDKQAVSIALDLQSEGQYPASFDQISANFYQSLGNTTIELANAENQILAQRMSAVRLGIKGFNAVGMQAALVNDRDGKNVNEAKGEKDVLKITPDTKWGVWVQGNGIFAKVTNISDVPSYRYQSGGFNFGVDYAWNEHLTTGVYAGYQGTYAKYSSDSSSEINQALFGGYASYQDGGFYADGIVGGGYNGYNTRRSINFSTISRTATATPNGGQFNTYLDAGYDVKVNKFTFGPLVSGQYTYAGIAPFTESGAQSLDLTVDQQSVNSLRTNLGGRIAYTWNVTDKITLIPEVRMFWQHEFLNNSRTIGASLNGGNGPGFNYQTANPGRDSVLATAGISAQIGDRWNANFYYTADFGNQSFLSSMISGGLEWKF